MKIADIQDDLSEFEKKLHLFSNSLKEKNTEKAANTRISSRVKRYITSKHDRSTSIIPVCKGIKIIYRYNNLTPTFVFYNYIKSGLINETRKTNGHHHLISSLLCKGHNDISFATFQKELDHLCALISGFSGRNSYGVCMHGQSKNIDVLLQHFFGVLTKSNFLSSELEHEKNMTIRAILSQTKSPQKQCFQAFAQLIFPNSPYQLDILGSLNSIGPTTVKQLKIFHYNNWKKNDLLFTYCGDLKRDDLLNKLNPYINKLKARDQKIKKLDFTTSHLSNQFTFIPFKREQSHILIGFPAYAFGKEKEIYFSILSSALSGQSSDLFYRMRDQLGLCYTISPTHFTALNGAYWGIYMSTSTLKTLRALKELYSIIENLQFKGLTQRIFNRVKTSIDGQLALSLQTNDDYANAYSIPEFHGLGHQYIYKKRKFIKDLTHKKFNDFIKKHFSGYKSLVVVGDPSLKSKISNQIQFL